MNIKPTDWLIFIALALIWGSSFILMKIGLDHQLSPFHIASIRIASSGLVLMPIAISSLKKIPVKSLWLVFLSGTLGSLIPAYLFCFAEQVIDSALAGTLNTLTPIFVIITGTLLFNNKTASHKIAGILVAFTGCVLLLLSKGDLQAPRQMGYVGLVILATLLYGFNVNMVSKYILHIPSLQIAAVGLWFNGLLALIVLIGTGYFHLPLGEINYIKGTSAAVCLGVMGTAIATILFYTLVKRASGIFASMVTYAIPFVAIGWGLYFGEQIGWKSIGSLLVILSGVYWANRKN